MTPARVAARRLGQQPGQGRCHKMAGGPGWGVTALPAWAACLLGAACVAWSAAPLPGTGLAGLALFLASACAGMGALRLLLARVTVPDDIFTSLPQRMGAAFLLAVRQPPWEECAVLSVLWLEVMHPARPWHTAGLGAALAAYLLAVHLGESRATPRVLRPQAPALAAGVLLLAAGAGAAMIPAVSAGGVSDWLRALAACAAVAAAALVVPLARTNRG